MISHAKRFNFQLIRRRLALKTEDAENRTPTTGGGERRHYTFFVRAPRDKYCSIQRFPASIEAAPCPFEPIQGLSVFP
jgi:hypothetical protein